MVLASLFIGGDPAGKFGGFDMHQDVAADLLILPQAPSVSCKCGINSTDNAKKIRRIL